MNNLYVFWNRQAFFLLLLSITLLMVGCQKEENLLQDEEKLVVNETSQVVLEWNQLFLELERNAIGMRPNATARALGYIHLAAYETVITGMPRFKSNNEDYSNLSISAEIVPNELDWQIALNTSYAMVFEHFIYGITDQKRTKIEVLRERLDTELQENVSDNIIADSKEWATYVATQVIRFSQTDISAEQQILDPQPISYEPPTGEGNWTYSHELERALFPYWGTTRTFVVAPDETATVPPIQYSDDPNSPFFTQMLETYIVNNRAKEENNEDLWIAEFWCDDVEGMMISPPTRQLSIAHQLIEQHELNLEESVLLLLKLGFALNDAAVATWKYKYEYMLVRPSDYIRDFIDPNYQTNLYRLVFWPNPTFPSYPSGHASFASAAAGVFISVFGNEVNFTDNTHQGREEFRGMPRTFQTFEQMAEENSFSRIPLGVHAKMDCTEGLRLGYEISAAVNNMKFYK